MKPTTIRLSPGLRARLDRLLVAAGGREVTSRSALVREALLLGLRRLERRYSARDQA